ncbi:MAG: D-alanyl-D-alanine carboxypeptidase [Treponema sp.]|nr:D-alanyl-D-alanine carboxypeptidase [Treponema sp.]
MFGQIFNAQEALVPYLEGAPEIVSRAAVLIDAHTGTILYSKNPDVGIPPASLAKLMTMHLVMKAAEEGEVSYDELIPITVDSWAQSQPMRSSLMFLEPGQTVTLREILIGMAVVSGNDAAVAAALRIVPNMEDFVNMMNEEVRRMGLQITRFIDASGISPHNRITAAEFASFCRLYINAHPESLEDFHSVPALSYPMSDNALERRRNNPRTITQRNSNVLLRTFPGVDGLKTGYINESGHNIALTAKRDETRFILVILGGPSQRRGARIRDNDSTILLNWAFENFKTVRPVIDKIENAKLWKGKENFVSLKLSGETDFTSPINRADSLKYEVVIPSSLIAPLPADFPAGYLKISDDHGELFRVPLVTERAHEKGNFFKRLWHSILLFFSK